MYALKRHVDFYMKTDYSYENMRTVLSVPLLWNKSVHHGVSLVPTKLTVKDGLYNPFDQETERSKYLSPEKVDIEWYG